VFSLLPGHTKRQSSSFVKCIFLQFTHTVLNEVEELRCGLRGNGIARFWIFESGDQEIEATATAPRLCLIGSPIARNMGGAVEEQYLRAPWVSRAISVDLVWLLTEASD
jgi:hypothetical protein